MISPDLEKSLQAAVLIAEQRRHDCVCLEHVLLALISNEKAADILKNVSVDLNDVANQLNVFLDKMPVVPKNVVFEMEQTPAITRVLQRAAAHVQSSGRKEINAGDILAAMFREQDSHAVYLLQKQGVSRLDILEYISHGISKVSELSNTNSENTLLDEANPSKSNDTSKRKDPLALFTVDLIAKAQAGKIDVLIGRSKEIERAIHVLCRRRKNNPIFVGEAGVGKTAIADGIALAIVQNKVPDILTNASLYALDMGALIAGTKFRGEFEQRLKSVIEAISKKEKGILFIDEIHTIVGAGSVGGNSLDASNLLKPALGSGEFRCMGSTTYKEYQGVFEKDRALARRFQKIDVREPSVHETIEILKGLKPAYEEYHQVSYQLRALQLCAELSHKYMNDRHLPDKAIDVMDEAGAAVHIKKRKTVRDADVEAVIAHMAQIPTETVSTTDKSRLENLARDLKLVIYGQDQAIEAIVSNIKLSRSGLARNNRPIGSFLFSGPTGVGKTELAKQLAQLLGVELLRFDMSEYMEKHTVSRLIGAPPGYVGYDQGGLLTDSVMKNPHAVLILDEIEKAHPDVFNLLLQVMDAGNLTDNNGRKADFKNIILILTTNAGAREMESGTMGFERKSSGHDAKGAIEKTFTPEFRNRLDGWVVFHHLSSNVIEQIVDKLLTELETQLEPKKIQLSVSAEARTWLAQNGYDRKFGARPMARLIDQKIRLPIADAILFGSLEHGGVASVHVLEHNIHVECQSLEKVSV